MSIRVKRQGQYELFETIQDHRVLVLDGRDYFAIVEGLKGLIIVESDSDHIRRKTIAEGEYALLSAKNEPDWKDNVEHLELKQKDEKYKTYILPEGLPTRQDYQKKFVESREYVPEEKVPEK